MRLIDADVLNKTITEEFHGVSATGFINFMYNKTPVEVYNKLRYLIDKAPTIISCDTYHHPEFGDIHMFDVREKEAENESDDM